jgi:hypothetical protein
MVRVRHFENGRKALPNGAADFLRANDCMVIA